MTQAISVNSLISLQDCISLATDLSRHEEATQAFAALKNHLDVENSPVAELVDMLWGELLSAQRSATVWEQICNVERELANQLTANNLQLQQNYLRLIQEQ